MKVASKKRLRQLLVAVLAVVFVNIVGNYVFARFDLTSDKRYTLSEVATDIAENVTDPLTIKVFLDGTLPGEFGRLKAETRQLLEEFRARNRNIRFEFVNPIGEDQDKEIKKEILYDLFLLDNSQLPASDKQRYRKRIDAMGDLDKGVFDWFYGMGMTPASVTLKSQGKTTEAIVFPWAIVTYGEKRVKVPLLKTYMNATTQESVVGSVQHLEYAFANAIHKATTEKSKKIAVIKGNDELPDVLMADFLRSIREDYHIGPFTLDSVAKNPKASSDYLKKNYDLAIIAKPKDRFTDEEIQVLDDYVMQGGRTLWLVDPVHMEMDSLAAGPSLAFPLDLNLNNLFFKYGIRLRPELIKDEYGTEIKLATGAEGSAQFTSYIWKYAPMALPQSGHPIVKNIEGVRFDFASPIELLRNDIKKTVLLHSSPFSRGIGTPAEISFDEVAEESSPKDYEGKGNLPMAVLLEGKFRSVYENRVLPFEEKDHRSLSPQNRMIVISDGDLLRNQLDKAYKPLELGFDKWTGRRYGNKDFMMNCVNYLLDDKGLIGIRSKDVDLPMIDPKKLESGYRRAQLITVALPLVALAVFGLVFMAVRRRMYAR